MALRTVLDPFGSEAVLVDKLIGNSYKVVRYVAYNIEFVKHVSANMAEIFRVAQSTTEIDLLVEKIAELETLHTNLTTILEVAAEIDNVKIVGENMAAVLAVNVKLTEILAVYAKLAEIEAVADELTKLLAIHTHLTELLAIHANLADLQTIAENLDDILASLNGATGVIDARLALVTTPDTNDNLLMTPEVSAAMISRRTKSFTLETMGYVSGPVETVLQAAYDRMNEDGDELILIGTYTTAVTVFGMQERDWKIKNQGGKFLAASGLLTSVMDIRCAPGARFDITIDGTEIDCSLGSTPDFSQQGCTALALQGQRNALIIHPRHKGNATPGYNHNHGDSGITVTDVDNFTVIQPYLPNWGDNGIYLTGGADAGPTDDGQTATIIGGLIFGSNNGIAAKRNLGNVTVVGTLIDLCRTGISTSETTSGHPPAARKVTLVDPLIRRSGAAALNIRAPSKLVGRARIEDFGYVPVNWNGNLEDYGAGTVGNTGNFGAIDVGANYRHAVVFEGAREADVDLDIRMSRWPSTSTHLGICTDDETINSVAYTAGFHNIRGRLINMQSGIQEGSGDPSQYNFMVDGITVPIITPRTGTRLRTVSKTGVVLESKTGVVQGTIAEVSNQALSGVGSLTAGSKSSVVTISTPGAIAGDKVNISRISSGLSGEPRYLISARAVTDGVQITVANTTASTYDFTAELISITVTR